MNMNEVGRRCGRYFMVGFAAGAVIAGVLGFCVGVMTSSS